MTKPLHLISSMATKALLADLLTEFESGTSRQVIAESVGGVDAAKRVSAGEAFDVVMLASKAIDELVASGHVRAGSKVDIVRSGVAIAVRQGLPMPAIGDEAAVRQAVLSAPSICFSTGPSGTYLLRLFERWGIAETIQERIIQAPPGVPVGRLLAEGRAELGFQQLSELLHVQGISLLGPLPDEIQLMTTFAAGVCETCTDPRAAQTFLEWMASPATSTAKRRQGMEPA